MSLNVDQIDSYERRAPDEDFQPETSPYPLPPNPGITRILDMPSTTCAFATLTVGTVPRQMHSGNDPRTVSRITVVAGEDDVYLTSLDDATVSSSFCLVAGASLVISTSTPIHVWALTDTTVGLIYQQWNVNDNRL